MLVLELRNKCAQPCFYSFILTPFRAQLGDTLKNNVGGKGFLDSANSQLLEMPWNTFEALMGEIEAKKDETTGRYYVDCEDVPDFPNLTVQLDGGGYLNDLHFPPAAYVDLVSYLRVKLLLVRSQWKASVLIILTKMSCSAQYLRGI